MAGRKEEKDPTEQKVKKSQRHERALPTRDRKSRGSKEGKSEGRRRAGDPYKVQVRGKGK